MAALSRGCKPGIKKPWLTGKKNVVSQAKKLELHQTVKIETSAIVFTVVKDRAVSFLSCFLTQCN